MPTTALPAPPQAKLYETDFYAWALQNAALLREGRFAEMDLQNIAEEIEALARKDYAQLRSRTAVVIAHLLKMRYQPSKSTRSWEKTIGTQRLEIESLLEDSPSLRQVLPQMPSLSWNRAVKQAMLDTRLDRGAFPAKCPFSLAEIYGDIVAQ